METTRDHAKSWAITREHWKRVLEALAWAVVAAFTTLLLQAHQVDRWGTEGKLGVLVVVMLVGVALTYLRSILFSQSRRFKTVEAESFLVKRHGLTVGKFGVEEAGGRLVLFDEHGVERVHIGISRDCADLMLYNGAGHPPAVLLAACEEHSRILLTSDEKLRLMFNAATGHGQDAFQIFDGEGNLLWAPP